MRVIRVIIVALWQHCWTGSCSDGGTDKGMAGRESWALPGTLHTGVRRNHQFIACLQC